MLRKKMFCDRLYLIAFKNLLLDNKENLLLNEHYSIVTKLGNPNIVSYPWNGMEDPLLSDAYCDEALVANISVVNWTTNLTEQQLIVQKKFQKIKLNGIGAVNIIKNLSIYQIADFILTKENNGKFSYNWYNLCDYEGNKIDKKLYNDVKKEFDRDYKCLKIYRNFAVYK